MGIQRRELSCACFGMVDGDTVLVAKCQGVAGSRRASATSFPKGCVGLIIAPLSSHFSKSQFLKEPKSPGISRRRVNPEQPPGIHPTSVPVAKPISRLGVQSHWKFVPFIYHGWFGVAMMENFPGLHQTVTNPKVCSGKG